ncbi:MAG: proteasome assembly chaperone family protein [Candidatus Kariarchaeaceae archaeon]|jgi:uncharacterized protein
MSESSTPSVSSLGKTTIEFIFKDDTIDFQGCTLVSGFYGIGKCGFIAINHMVQRLEAKLIGHILSDFLPPFLSVKDERLVLPFEIYKYKDIIFITAFFEPYKYEHRSFARSIVDWSKKNGITRAILIGGLDSRLRTDEEVLAKAVYTSSYKAKFQEEPLPLMDEGLYITGPMALLLMYAEIGDLPAVGILPYAERSRPDPIGASIAVEIVNDLLGTDCGVEELVQEAESIENEIQSMEGIIREEKEEDESRDRGMFL